MGCDLARPEFEERCFRFSVRCDRDMNQRLELAARKAGLSVTALVQRHFETILDDPADAAGFSPQVFARGNDVSVQAARLWKAMSATAGPDGEITGAAREFCRTAKISQGAASDHLAELVRVGLVTVLRRPVSGHAGVYRVKAPAS
jgi:hypothetical protein